MTIELMNPVDLTPVYINTRIVLASASPRRASILSALGFEFDLAPADLDEDAVAAPSPAALARTLAVAKADAVSFEYPEACVIAADTVVALDGESVGKPCDANDAALMLERLSGSDHEVHTGVCVRRGTVSAWGVETTVVKMRSLSTEEIREYVDSGAAMDKAGAYGIQDSTLHPVESFNGSYLNVVGLPVGLLGRLLLQAGVIDAGTAESMGRKDEPWASLA